MRCASANRSRCASSRRKMSGCRYSGPRRAPMQLEGYPEKQVRITGIGQSKVGRPSDRTALQLTADACLQALDDAGLTAADIDGVSNYPGKSAEGGGIAPVGVTETMVMLGL